MAITASQGSEKTFELLPEGIHPAICYGIVDLGVQENKNYNNKSRKVRILWELTEETTKDGKRKTTGKEYTLSLNEKATLRKDLQSWRGKSFTKEELDAFDLKNVLGKPCQLQIIHITSQTTGKNYDTISSVVSVPKGMKFDAPQNELLYFDLSENDFDKISEQLQELPEWISKKVRESETYQDLLKPVASESFTADEITSAEEMPF